MNSLRVVIFVLLGSLMSLTGFASAASEDAAPVNNADQLENAAPVATVEIESTQIRLILGGSWGNGNLHYQGQTYPFKIKGFSIGGIGITETQAEGDVYLLNKLEDFPGSYSAVTMGATLVKGKGGASVQNDLGVLMKLRSSSTGVGLSLGVSGVQVQFEE